MEQESKIDSSKIVLVPKQTKLQYDMHTSGLTRQDVIEKYNREGMNTATILESHELQLDNLARLRELLRPTVLLREELSRDALAPFGLVIAFGGDNHFQYVSHFLDDKPILGINSDPVRSDGALVQFTLDSFTHFLPFLADATTENWTRLAVMLNGKDIPTLCLSEIFAGEYGRQDMSRYLIQHGDINEMHKNSGLIIATGCGSTGWYGAACKYLHPEGNTFPKAQAQAVFLATEPFEGRLSTGRTDEGYLVSGQELVIRSLNDHRGILSLDSLDSYEFNNGSIARVRISDKPLIVVVPQT